MNADIDQTRYPHDELLTINESIKKEKLLTTSVNSFPLPVLFLHSSRQIVYANYCLLQMTGKKDSSEFLDFRPGEILGCIHADSTKHGCGASPLCSACAAVNTVLESQRTGKQVGNDAFILTRVSDRYQAWDFYVTASPIEIASHALTMVTFKDISAENRKGVLERIFIHDMTNSIEALNLANSFDEFKAKSGGIDLQELRKALILQLGSEITNYRQLVKAENGDLVITPYRINILTEIRELADEYTFIKKARHKEKLHIDIVTAQKELYIQTDRSLLRQIVENMIKNAFEASSEIDKIIIRINKKDSQVTISVHNDSVIPPEHRRDVFYRSFSTKGDNRGIGTYSIKVLTENYLGGQAWFTSAEGKGTEFFISLPL